MLNELGLDVPTAIRMYLNSVVRENGLPFNTKLPKKPVSTPITTSIPTPVVDEPAAPIGKTLTADELFEEEQTEPEQIEPAVEETTTPVEEEAAEEETAPAVTIDYDTRAGRKAIAQLFIDAICAVPA